MADPYFKLRREVHVVRNHCASCSKLESQMQHPIKVRAILAYGEGFTYRIEDAKGACFNISEACLCSSSSGHSSRPCVFCGQANRVVGRPIWHLPDQPNLGVFSSRGTGKVQAAAVCLTPL